MPFKSRTQARWANSPAGLRSLGGKDKVDEFNASTNFSDIPEKVDGAISKAMKSRRPAATSAGGALSKRFQAK